MDIEDGQFIEELMDSLKSGFDFSRPILIAKSDNGLLDGVVIDGRHKCYCLSKLKEKGMSLPQPFPISYIEVRDANHLRGLIAEHKERSRGKGARYSKAWARGNLFGLTEDECLNNYVRWSLSRVTSINTQYTFLSMISMCLFKWELASPFSTLRSISTST